MNFEKMYFVKDGILFFININKSIYKPIFVMLLIFEFFKYSIIIFIQFEDPCLNIIISNNIT